MVYYWCSHLCCQYRFEHLVGLAGTGAKAGVGMAHWEMQGWMILILGWLLYPSINC